MDRSANELPTPFAEMAAMLRRFRDEGRSRTVDGARLEDLLEAAAVLEAVSAWAAEMQLGAEGFDNTESARAYDEVQEQLAAAARHIQRACEVLDRRDWRR